MVLRILTHNVMILWMRFSTEQDGSILPLTKRRRPCAANKLSPGRVKSRRRWRLRKAAKCHQEVGKLSSENMASQRKQFNATSLEQPV
jgi:hypothetical protein